MAWYSLTPKKVSRKYLLVWKSVSPSSAKSSLLKLGGWNLVEFLCIDNGESIVPQSSIPKISSSVKGFCFGSKFSIGMEL